MNDENKPRILIVDDDTKNIQVLGTVLRLEGYSIYVAQSGRDALKIVKEIKPDLILLDIMMPELSGFETCKKLKKINSINDVPIIFLTARTDTKDIVKGFNLGASDYVTKPFDSVELLARVQTHLDLKFSKDRIRTISNERRELLHILCHDLNHPLSVIFYLFEIIRDDFTRFAKEKDRFVSHAFSVIKNSRTLIDLVRKMRMLEDYEIELNAICLKDAVSESNNLLKSMFIEKGITLKIHIDDHLEIMAEKTSLVHSVINNILSNAVKFSDPGATVWINSAETDEQKIQLSIRDNGIGIPEEILEDLFIVGKTTIRKGTLGERGTGYGMVLVKKFMNAYHGGIEVLSGIEEDGTEIRLLFQSA